MGQRRQLTCAITAVCLVLSANQARAQGVEPPAGAPFSPYPATVLVTKVNHFDNMCWKIATAGGTFYFETGETAGKSGFSSAFDQAGNDWIGNDADKGYNESPATGGKREYRGWPNFGEGNFDHPQRSSGATTRWVDEAGTTIPFADKLEGEHLRMRSSNATYELEYHFFRTHAAIKVLKADSKYAFLYEGPVGGEQETAVTKDYYVLKDGKARELKAGGLGFLEPEFNNKFPSPFFYLVDSDPKDTQVWYVGVKGQAPDTAGDEGWRQGNNMVIFSYGRDQDKRAYTGTAAVSVFGFYPKAAGHDGISAFIEARLQDPFTPGSDAGGGAGAGGAAAMGGSAGSSGGGVGGAVGGAAASGGSAGSGTPGAGGTVAVGGAGATTGGADATAGGASATTGGTSATGGSSVTSAGASSTTGGSATSQGGSRTSGSAGTTAEDDSGCSVSAGKSRATPWLGLLAVLPLAWKRRRTLKRRSR